MLHQSETRVLQFLYVMLHHPNFLYVMQKNIMSFPMEIATTGGSILRETPDPNHLDPTAKVSARPWAPDQLALQGLDLGIFSRLRFFLFRLKRIKNPIRKIFVSWKDGKGWKKHVKIHVNFLKHVDFPDDLNMLKNPYGMGIYGQCSINVTVTSVLNGDPGDPWDPMHSTWNIGKAAMKSSHGNQSPPTRYPAW